MDEDIIWPSDRAYSLGNYVADEDGFGKTRSSGRGLHGNMRPRHAEGRPISKATRQAIWDCRVMERRVHGDRETGWLCGR